MEIVGVVLTVGAAAALISGLLSWRNGGQDLAAAGGTMAALVASGAIKSLPLGLRYTAAAIAIGSAAAVAASTPREVWQRRRVETTLAATTLVALAAYVLFDVSQSAQEILAGIAGVSGMLFIGVSLVRSFTGLRSARGA